LQKKVLGRRRENSPQEWGVVVGQFNTHNVALVKRFTVTTLLYFKLEPILIINLGHCHHHPHFSRGGEKKVF
jgi:predicted amidohydrolase YtcJ